MARVGNIAGKLINGEVGYKVEGEFISERWAFIPVYHLHAMME
jgi:hypothetical protein